MTPTEVREQIREVVDALPLPEGELMLRAHASDTTTPLDTIEALMEAMEERCLP